MYEDAQTYKPKMLHSLCFTFHKLPLLS